MRECKIVGPKWGKIPPSRPLYPSTHPLVISPKLRPFPLPDLTRYPSCFPIFTGSDAYSGKTRCRPWSPVPGIVWFSHRRMSLSLPWKYTGVSFVLAAFLCGFCVFLGLDSVLVHRILWSTKTPPSETWRVEMHPETGKRSGYINMPGYTRQR